MPPSRFHLEHALAAWRSSLEHNRAFGAEDVEELERHVRDPVFVHDSVARLERIVRGRGGLFRAYNMPGRRRDLKGEGISGKRRA